ncbi:hypothetical protein B0F90DRAFT_1691319 [Multifurca ochricompacta]|uniref:Uncharacterized protein n=1 Tax=Multifurca ochricompacta TaxID=376703 RepID=A0AAD4QS46_9AGAM|nr:hypothetical protein B0F90DRAFT_1691319 [Multifurca ochricompacta]
MGIPGDIGVPATENLRFYLSQAVLPLMKMPRNAPRLPPSGHRSHNIGLSTRPERYRRLELVSQGLGIDVEVEVPNYSGHVVPDHPLEEGDCNSETGIAIRIPCNPTFDIPQPPMIPPTDLDRFASWLVYLPLQTTERAMHLVHPKSRPWSFVCQNGDMDDAHFKYYAWELEPCVPSTSGRKTTVIVMAMPPWTLTPTDLQCFAACKEFPLFNESRRARFNDDERIWGKLYDICLSRDSPYFVVTNYYGWVFGVFSKGWSTAFVGKVQTYADLKPTILQYLLYWLSSSMNEPGTYSRPEVPETHIKRGLIPQTLDRGLVTVYDTRCDQSDSESFWERKNDDLQSGFSFAAESDISHADSDRTITYRPSKARRSYDPRDWLSACEEAREGDITSECTLNEDAASDATSQWSSFSASTIRAGNWINPVPLPLRQAPAPIVGCVMTRV